MSLHQLPPLPYPLNALEPHISKETLEYHHGKHHRTYVDKLNELVAGTQYENLPLEDVVKWSKGATFNNAAQAWNHTFYWNSLAAAGSGGKPTGDLARAIDGKFGSFMTFKKQFSAAATDFFGSGWVWLVAEADGSLAIHAVPNAQTPLTTDARPLLACDIWEHAYYIDHRNSRPDYLKAFWALANWKFAARNYTNRNAEQTDQMSMSAL